MYTNPISRNLVSAQDSIPYRKELNAITGSPIATILFQQIIYWWFKMGGKPFYKYITPPKSPKVSYKTGDSWVEELGFKRNQFENAIKNIATKVKKGDSRAKSLENSIIIYWTDINRVTWYEVNQKNLEATLYNLYRMPLNYVIQNPELRNSESRITYKHENTTEPPNARMCAYANKNLFEKTKEKEEKDINSLEPMFDRYTASEIVQALNLFYSEDNKKKLFIETYEMSSIGFDNFKTKFSQKILGYKARIVSWDQLNSLFVSWYLREKNSFTVKKSCYDIDILLSTAKQKNEEFYFLISESKQAICEYLDQVILLINSLPILNKVDGLNSKDFTELLFKFKGRKKRSRMIAHIKTVAREKKYTLTFNRLFDAILKVEETWTQS